MDNLKLIYLNKSLKLINSNFKLREKNVFIKVKSCGICGSDLKILNFGSKRIANGRVMGHEIAGQIIDAKTKKTTNKNIVLGADILSKKKNDYALGHELDGGFQKYLIIPKKILSNTPHYITTKKIDYNLASLSEPLACCLNGFKKMNFKKNKNVLIFGAGPIGYLIASLAIYFKSKKIIIIDNNIRRLNIGLKNKKLFKLNLNNYKKKLDKIISKNEIIDYGFVACNSTKAQSEILKIVGKNATVNFFSGIKNKNKSINTYLDTNLIHYKQLNVVGSHGSNQKDLISSAKLIVGKKIKIKKIITNSYKLTDFVRAFNKFKSGKSLKVVINP